MLLSGHEGRTESYKGNLAIRFSINRHAYRYPAGIKMNADELKFERFNGFKNSRSAVFLRDRVEEILKKADDSFTMDWLREEMSPSSSKNKISVLFDEYVKERVQLNLKRKTRLMDVTVQNQLTEFLKKHPNLDDVMNWNPKTLTTLERFIKKGRAIMEEEAA